MSNATSLKSGQVYRWK